MNPTHAAAARWLVHHTNPYVSAARKKAVTDSFESVMSAHPEWGRMWLSGVTSSILATLPGDDPWRHLGGRIVGGGVDIVRPGPAGRIPDGVGAAGAEGPFGTFLDFNDLASPESPDPLTDIIYAAAADPLEPAASAFLAFAAQGWRQAFSAATELEVSHGVLSSEFATEALRWAMLRRSLYVSWDDRFSVLVGFWWLGRSDRLLSDPNRTDIESDIASEIDESSIPEGSWEALTEPFSPLES